MSEPITLRVEADATDARAELRRVERMVGHATTLHQVAKQMHADAGEMNEAGDTLAPLAGFAATLASLAAGCLLTRTLAPTAMLAAIMARLGVRHQDMPEEEAGELLVAMLTDPKRRELLIDCATEAVDDWLTPSGTAADGYEWFEGEAPDGPDLGERIGGFEPPTGDEVELEPLS